MKLLQFVSGIKVMPQEEIYGIIVDEEKSYTYNHSHKNL